MLHQHRFTLLGTLLLTLFLSGPVHSAVVVSVQSTTLNEGAAGFFNVFVEGNSELVQAFDFEIQITPLGAVTSALWFDLYQPDPHLFDPTYAPNYLFVGNSDDIDTPIPFSFVTTTNLQQDTLVASDATSDGTDIAISSPRLLGRFAVTSILPLNTTLSTAEQFQVTIDANFIDSNLQPVEVISNHGTIDIISIPEPTSFVLISIGVLTTCFRRRLSSRLTH